MEAWFVFEIGFFFIAINTMISGSTIFGNSSIQQALKKVDVDINL